MAQIAKIKLNKEIYGSKGTIDSLDTDFKELKIKKYTVGE